jgi:hypothetical protein
MSGLGLSGFLTHNQDTARKFLHDWQRTTGETVVWLYTQSNVAWVSWNHPFIEYGTFKDDNGEEHDCLKYPRFVSPDPEIVHENQYFNDSKTQRMQVPPMKDPFLLLREWLKHHCDYPLETVIFRWENPRPKPGDMPIVEWTRGHLSRLVKRGKSTYNHSLDTKLNYHFVVVDNERPVDGLQMVRVTKLLGSCMQKEIKQQIDSRGDFGNPLIHPYAFKWKYNEGSKSPMDSYSAYRFDGVELTDEIKEIITSEILPKSCDPSPDCRPRSGDKMRIRAAMEAAAQVDLPWDLFFVPQWVDDDPGSFNYGNNKAQESLNEERVSTPSISSQTSSEHVSTPKARRRKKVVESAPKPEVEIEMVPSLPCDDCGKSIPINATRCECGAEYEVDNDLEENSVITTKAELEVESESSEEVCFSCRGKIVDDKCSECGLESADEIPF